MYALVDFDNVPDTVTKKGLRYVADRVWTSIGQIDPALALGTGRLDVRFYGGWRGRQAPSPRGSHLIAEAQREFPFVIRGNRPITIAGELAQSLLLLPKHELPHTFRPRHGGQNLGCHHPSKLGCAVQDCPVLGVHAFLVGGKCTSTTCGRAADGFLIKTEQKLVDTMLVCDLIHLSLINEAHAAVVSSDDDLWPGMLTAMSNGTGILQIGTKYPSTHTEYHGMIFGRYKFGRL
jgi:hypothetical protein